LNNFDNCCEYIKEAGIEIPAPYLTKPGETSNLSLEKPIKTTTRI
jgi:hypothetical protein